MSWLPSKRGSSRATRHCHSTSMIEDHSAIQQLVCRPGLGMCDRFEFIAVASFSYAVFSSASESENSHTAFSTGHADSHGPPPTSSQTSHWSYRRANTTTSTTPYFVYFLAGSIRPRSLLVVLQHLKPQLTLISASHPADLIIKEPPAPRSSSFSGQQFQSSTSTPTTFIITRPPTKHRAYEAQRAASTSG